MKLFGIKNYVPNQLFLLGSFLFYAHYFFRERVYPLLFSEKKLLRGPSDFPLKSSA